MKTNRKKASSFAEDLLDKWYLNSGVVTRPELGDAIKVAKPDDIDNHQYVSKWVQGYVAESLQGECCRTCKSILTICVTQKIWPGRSPGHDVGATSVAPKSKKKNDLLFSDDCRDHFEGVYSDISDDESCCTDDGMSAAVDELHVG